MYSFYRHYIGGGTAYAFVLLNKAFYTGNSQMAFD